jgi:hypothetical protein
MTRHRTLPYLLVLGILLIGGAVWLSLNLPARTISRRQFAGSGTLFRTQLRAATAQEKKQAVAVIRAQLDAFRRDDYTAAAKYQSTSLKKNFASTAAFRRSIQRNYPQFARSKNVSFGPMQADKQGQTIMAPVTLTGRDNVTVKGVYILQREGKEYRVSGVLGGVNPKEKTPHQTPENKLSPEMVA